MKMKPLLEVAEDIMNDIKEAKKMSTKEKYDKWVKKKITDEDIDLSGVKMLEEASLTMFDECMQNESIDDALILSKRDWDALKESRKNEQDKKFKLCLVLDNQAWFTTQDVTKQWGDDWDDAPYEHNAGPPYEWDGSLSSKAYDIKKVYWESDKYFTPGMTRSDSVDNINDGIYPWFISYIGGQSIDAATTLKEFKKLVDVYEKV